MTDPEMKARGVQAEALLTDPLLREAIKAVKFAAHRAFERSNGDADLLRRSSDVYQAACDFQRYLTIAMKNGAAAAKRIDRDLQGGRVVRGIGRLARSRRLEVDDAPWREVV